MRGLWKCLRGDGPTILEMMTDRRRPQIAGHKVLVEGTCRGKQQRRAGRGRRSIRFIHCLLPPIWSASIGGKNMEE